MNKIEIPDFFTDLDYRNKAMAEQKKSHLTVLFITVVLYLVGFGLVIPILPVLSREFGATPLQVGLIMSIFSLMQFLFAPFWGKLSDRLGRRPVILGCLVGEALSYFALSLVNNLELMFLARALAGFLGPVSQQYPQQFQM